MHHTELGIMKQDALDNLGAYWDRPFDVFEDNGRYELDFYTLPAEWMDRLGESKAMDWGSFLYVCDYEKLKELFEVKPSKILQFVEYKKRVHTYTKVIEIDLSSLPADRMYGIYDIKDY